MPSMHASCTTTHRALYRALSHRLLAQAHWDKGDHGVAIGLMSQAQALLKARADATSAGLPAIDRSRVCMYSCVCACLLTGALLVVSPLRRISKSIQPLYTLFLNPVPEPVPAAARHLAQGGERPPDLVEAGNNAAGIYMLMMIEPRGGEELPSAPLASRSVSHSESSIHPTPHTQQDNNMIYFAAVPDPTSLPPLPSGTNMVGSASVGSARTSFLAVPD